MASGTVIDGLQLDLGAVHCGVRGNGGKQYGGRGISTTIKSGGEQLLAGGTASGTTVKSGGLQYRRGVMGALTWKPGRPAIDLVF
jgi:autotransporter passenger strand-loop-strand repeat protein